jgi:hypothetical protein
VLLLRSGIRGAIHRGPYGGVRVDSPSHQKLVFDCEGEEMVSMSRLHISALHPKFRSFKINLGFLTFNIGAWPRL